MSRTINLSIVLGLFIIYSSCASSYKSKMKSQSQYIRLQQLEDVKTLQIYNDHVKIYLDFTAITESLEGRSDEHEELRQYLNNNSEPILLENNLQFKTLHQATLFPFVWEYLKQGKAKVFYKKSGDFVEVIEFVKVNNINGEQEYFRIIEGDIFFSKIITLGE